MLFRSAKSGQRPIEKVGKKDVPPCTQCGKPHRGVCWSTAPTSSMPPLTLNQKQNAAIQERKQEKKANGKAPGGRKSHYQPSGKPKDDGPITLPGVNLPNRELTGREKKALRVIQRMVGGGTTGAEEPNANSS